ncbi:MAG: hypothetical protein U9Q20_02210 [Campylobacterota bacterium]|nr:hypothetical protein [Campylobacterota bacterium]
MNILEKLISKLDQMSKEFEFLIEENKNLKRELDEYKNKDDLATRNSQDMILAIKTKLKEKGQF